jgi:uncharacterized protein (DUF488 family)
MQIFTIGFTKTSAEYFFEALKTNGIEQLIDVRLNNSSQLAGYSKKEDLEYFLKVICNATYKHEMLLAPTQLMLDDFKKYRGPWSTYKRRYLELLEHREVETKLNAEMFERPTVLLCSEETAEQCHRSLVIEYLNAKWGNVEAKHL